MQPMVLVLGAYVLEQLYQRVVIHLIPSSIELPKQLEPLWLKVVYFS